MSVNQLPEAEDRQFAFVRDITGRRQAEETLALLHRQHHLILHSTAEGILGLDLEGHHTFVNPAAARMLGHEAGELIGRPSHSIWHHTRADGSPYPQAECLILRTLRDGIVHRSNAEVFWRQDGTSFPVEYASTPILEKGQLVGAVVTFADITERQQLEQQLAGKIAHLKAIYESEPECVKIVSPEGVLLEMNPAGLKMIGAESLAQAQSRPLLEFVAPEHQTAFRETIGQVLQGRSVTLQFESVGLKGQRHWLESHAVPLRDPASGRTNLLSVTRDITGRRQAEKSLRLQTTALNAAANAIVITDREGKIEWVNAAFTAFTGYTATEAVGQNPRLLKSGKHAPAFYQSLWDTILTGKVWQGEMINRRKDGTFYTEDMTITPLKDKRGTITHFIAVKQDITQRKLLEEEFRQSQKMEAFGQLAGGVAHDFNNILTIIQGNASLMQTGLSAADSKEALSQIAQAATRAAGLTRQLLAFSRRSIMQPRPLNLNDAVTSTSKMLQRLIGEDIVLQTELLPGGAPVQADPGMIEQVLFNLAVNSRDAMPAGGRLGIVLEDVTLDEAAAARRPPARPGRFVRLTLRDTGQGIPPEVLPHIFEPFYTTKDVGKGTGLGLATVDGIVAQHCGWVEVASAVGQGTAFHVYLPRLAAGLPVEPAEAVAARVRGGAETVLLVEDEPALRTLATRALKHYGYQVLTADSGVAALELWRQQGRAVDLLLTDIIMPDGVSGSELAGQLQAANPKLKVIYMSGYPGEVAGRGLDLRPGVNFLQKPFTPAKLAQIVRDCLDAALER